MELFKQLYRPRQGFETSLPFFTISQLEEVLSFDAIFNKNLHKLGDPKKVSWQASDPLYNVIKGGELKGNKESCCVFNEMLYLIRQYRLLARRSQFIRDTRTNTKQEANPFTSSEFSPDSCLPSSSRDEMRGEKWRRWGSTCPEYWNLNFYWFECVGWIFVSWTRRKQLQGAFQFTLVGIFRILSEWSQGIKNDKATATRSSSAVKLLTSSQMLKGYVYMGLVYILSYSTILKCSVWYLILAFTFRAFGRCFCPKRHIVIHKFKH